MNYFKKAVHKRTNKRKCKPNEPTNENVNRTNFVYSQVYGTVYT